ncbi:MAG: FGGY-family carbohydrate kinase [Deltaproteobacteria bacterium]|nr:FGGY-family carbohydrate kinase [Deltaproteobacteria bacterium]
MDKYVLAIDHGTSGLKTSIISMRGEVMAFEFAKTPIHFFRNGGAEQDPQDWWNALITTSQRLVARHIVPTEAIVAICVSSTFSSTVAVDRDGNHLFNSITWMDSRGAPYIKKIMGGFPSLEGYNLFRIMRWIPKTAGGPTLSGKDDIAHVLLIKNDYPQIYARTYKFLPSKDYLNLRLTGEFASSYDAIHLFWVTNTRDCNHIFYDDALIKMLGIDKKKLPVLKRSIDILGCVKPEVARAIGIGENVQVVMGSADHQAALIGSGAVRDYEGHIYIGTSSWVQCVVPFKKTDMFHSIASLPSAIPGKYQSVNEQDIAGGTLNFLIDNILYYKNRLLKGEIPENIYDELNEIAAQVPAGSNKLIVTPWLNGERTPVDDNTVRAGIYNVSKTTTQDDIVRAFFEGVAYNTRWSFQYLERFTGRRLDPLNIIGGGGKSNLWCQIFADVLNRTIRQVRDPMQANGRGAAFIASVALGFTSFDEIPNLIQYTNIFQPNPNNRKIYDELYREFINIYRQNKAIYHRLNMS